MARLNLSERLAGRIGKRTSKGTLITDDLVGKVYGDEQLSIKIEEDNTRQIQMALKQAIAAALEECGLAAERFAKRETPVDTGRLRNSITHALDLGDDAVYVGTNVEYAPYVELGVHGRPGKRMLTHAAADHQDYYERVIKRHLEGGQSILGVSITED